MSSSRDRIERLHRLRELFLDQDRGAAAQRDYWRDEGDLQAYAEVLAARIGWKWDAALAECRDRGFGRADAAQVLDFGCGSGVAAARFVQHFGAREVLCHDRSATAMQFAVRELAVAHPGLRIAPCADVDGLAPDVLLVSHVLGELDERGEARLRRLVERARRVVVVEPGDHATSRRLGALRDALLTAFRVVAPCPHAARCPALASARDWCHFFAPPPPALFTDGEWVKTARQLGVDLRSLPYSFLALEAGSASGAAAPPHRLLGRPVLRKHEAVVQTCTATGLAERAVSRRLEPGTFRALKQQPASVRALPPDRA